MRTPFNGKYFSDFIKTFPTANMFGEWTDEADHVHTYYTNAAGEVGEIVYNKRTTCSTYFVIVGETAAAVKSYYRA